VIAKPVTITYNVDEQTNIGVLDGKYVKFAVDEAGVENSAEILVADAVNEYVAAQIRVPDEFVEIREAVQTKINALQAVL
jgi:hypothetical protein